MKCHTLKAWQLVHIHICMYLSDHAVIKYLLHNGGEVIIKLTAIKYGSHIKILILKQFYLHTKISYILSKCLLYLHPQIHTYVHAYKHLQKRIYIPRWHPLTRQSTPTSTMLIIFSRLTGTNMAKTKTYGACLLLIRNFKRFAICKIPFDN